MGLPSAQAGSVVMVCEGGMLKAYGWRGLPLWTYYAQGRLAPFITRSREGTSYVATAGGILTAVNRAGRELWKINLGAPLAAPVLSGWDGRIFVFTGTDLACFTASGYPLWRLALESPPALPPSPDLRGGFVTVLESGELFRFNAFGAVRSRELPGLPAVAVVLRLPGERELSIFLAYPDGRMEIHGEYMEEEPKTLETIIPGRPLAAVSRGGRAALTLEDGRVLLVDGSGGEVLWSAQGHGTTGGGRGGPGETGMIFDERGIYTLSRTGAAGFTEDGRRLWLIRLEGAAALPAFSDEGVLYSGGRDWILYAYRPEDRVRSVRQSIYGPVPEGSYGMGNPPPSSMADYPFRFDEEEIRGRLDRIGADIRRGLVGTGEGEYTAYLMEIAGSLPNPAPVQTAPVQARYRAEAARLLSFIGSRETVPFLANLFTRDPDLLVKAAAAAALGRIGIDPEGIALRAFSGAVFPPAPLYDDQVLAAVAAATGALCRFSGPPLADAGVRLLTALGSGSRPPVVRNQALRELQTLR